MAQLFPSVVADVVIFARGARPAWWQRLRFPRVQGRKCHALRAPADIFKCIALCARSYIEPCIGRRAQAQAVADFGVPATMSAETFLFTSESVNEGHPDKICDQVSAKSLSSAWCSHVTSHMLASEHPA